MKKTRHSLIALLLVLVMVLSMFAACGTDSGDASSSTKGQTDQTDTESTEGNDSTDSSTETGDTGDTSTPGETSSDIPGGVDPGPGGDTASNGVLPVIQYLRIREIGLKSVYLRLNTNYTSFDFEVRYSKSEITESNFSKATIVDTVSITKGNGYIDLEIKNMTANEDNMYYIAVQAKNGKDLSTIEVVRAGGIQIISPDSGQIYAGDVIRDFSKLFDEQTTVGDPYNGRNRIPPSSTVPKFGYKTENSEFIIETPNKNSKGNYLLSPIVDLLNLYYIECVYVYYGSTAYPITLRVSENAANFDDEDDWDRVIDVETARNNWTKIDIQRDIQYIQFLFEDGQAPAEILIYGYALSEGEVEVSTSTANREYAKISDFLGMCGLVNSKTTDFMPGNFVREYHNLGWAYNFSAFATKPFNNGTPHGPADGHYLSWLTSGIKAIPCIQWTREDDVAKFHYIDDKGRLVLDTVNKTSNLDKFTPDVYASYADLVFQYAARFGHTSNDALLKIHSNRSGVSVKRLDQIGLGYIDWIELGNEPNGEDDAGYCAYQLAALTSAAYDGHMRTVLAEYLAEDNYFLGAKNADPEIKLAMAGLAGIGTNYIKAMCYWMRANREGFEAGSNESIAMDAFNVHSYFVKEFIMNGQSVLAGISPEEYGLIDHLAGLVEYRNKYYPDVEVWITEFGWDTNQSYLTKTSAHAYGEYSAWDVQAMWLTRAYLLLSASGVDKAAMYMTLDATNKSEEESVGQYGTCGIINAKGEKKTSYYSLYTLKSTLNDYRFAREINSGNVDVWIYQYKTDDGKTAYALWCPTSDGTKVNNFKFNIGANSATLVENKHGEIAGVKTKLTSSNGVVTVNVSENPIYIVID